MLQVSHNNMNRVLNQTPGGALRFSGTLNEAATVTVQGKPATVSADNKFEGQTAVNSDTSTVEVKAKDYTGNERTNAYQVSQSGSTKTFTHDNNGNLTGDGTRTFEWDAENRLLATNQGTLRSEFTYDGLDRRVRVEKNNSVVTSDKRLLWCELEICEERDSSGTTTTKRFFPQGEQQGTDNYFYTPDHVGSVRELVDNMGAIRARYEYDPYGRITKLFGDKATTFGFTGHQWQETGALWLALYRGYDSDLARWLSEDPSGFVDGPNLYSYVRNTPVTQIDPLGLESRAPCAAGNPDELKKCLEACDKGTKGREKYCRTLKNPRLRAGCWALVYGSKAACKGWCYWQFGG